MLQLEMHVQYLRKGTILAFLYMHVHKLYSLLLMPFTAISLTFDHPEATDSMFSNEPHSHIWTE